MPSPSPAAPTAVPVATADPAADLPRWRRVLHEVVVVGLPVLSMTFSLGIEPDDEVAPRLVTAAVVVVLLLLRRRAPLLVTAGAALLLLTGQPVQVAALVALLAVAVRSSWRRTSLAAGLLLLGYTAALALRAGAGSWRAWLESASVLVTAAALLLGATAGVGLYVGARRQLLVEARERAERAEADRARHAEQARERERARIAREMHDVLAHRLSVLALHAGALEYRAGDVGGEVAQAAGVVREGAHQALQELRDVLGVLRAASSDDDGHHGRTGPPAPGLRPQPALVDVAGLVDEAARAAGTPVRLAVDGDLAAATAAAGRAAYRVVQEGLTNARRHAPGAPVAVTVRVVPGDGGAVEVEVRNDRPPPTPGGPPARTLDGPGSGLLGVVERAALLGGHVEHGATADGGFRLAARLPTASPGGAPGGDAATALGGSSA